MNGRCSIFGGPGDKGMANDSGLALYEPKEADLRPDIFTPAPACVILKKASTVGLFQTKTKGKQVDQTKTTYL